MLLFGLEKKNRTFLVTSKPLKYVRWYLVCCFFFSKYIIFAAFWGLTCNCVGGVCFLVFSHPKNTFVASFELFDYSGRFSLLIFSCWIARFIHCYFLVCWRNPKRSRYLFVTTLTSKNISSYLFVVLFSLNMFLLPFPGLLTLKSINHSYILAVSSPNRHALIFYL